MICIEIDKRKDDYNIVRVSDKEGIICSYCGFYKWASFVLMEDYGIWIDL